MDVLVFESVGCHGPEGGDSGGRTHAALRSYSLRMSAPDADLIVVGAGFAGLACAQASAWRGLRTVVLDRRPAAGHHPHTTGILVKEVADEWDVPPRFTRKIHGVRLYGPSLRSVDLVSPGYYFLATDTTAVLRWWAEQAQRAGAVVRFGKPYRGAGHDGDFIRLAGHGLSGRFLVGADGARSRVAADFGLSQNRQFLGGVELEYEGVGGVDEDRLHVFLDSDLAPGYIAWVVPGLGITQVGLAARHPHVPRIDDFVQKVGKLFDFDRARQVGCRAGRIPVGGPLRRISAPNVLLVGDAAGHVSPLTAGGIHTALQFGRQAGLAICDHLLDGGFEPVRALQPSRPAFFWKRLLRVAFDLGPPNWLYDLLLGSRPLRVVAQTTFYHHRGLLAPQAWRDLVLALR